MGKIIPAMIVDNPTYPEKNKVNSPPGRMKELFKETPNNISGKYIYYYILIYT